MRNTMRTLLLGLLVSGCAMDAHDAASDEVATTAQDSTVLNNCAVGNAVNATGTISVGVGDSYTRSDLTMDLIGTNRCDCIDWQGVYDVDGEAAANAAYPTCRPDAFVNFTVSKPLGATAHFQVFSEMTDHIHNATDCSHSNLHMELWKSTGRGIWQRLWTGTQTAYWDGYRCFQTVGEASPSVASGLYRVKAVGTFANEQGYSTITISGS